MIQISQEEIYFSASRCFFLLAAHHHVKLEDKALVETDKKSTIQSIMRDMKDAGFKTKPLHKCKWNHLISLGSAFPVIAIHKDQSWLFINSAVTLDDGSISVAIINPFLESDTVQILSRDEFLNIWSGTLLLCKKNKEKHKLHEQFGFSWFIPDIAHNARSYRDIAILTVIINQLGLVPPILFQIVIDRVVSFRSYQTLIAVILVYVYFVACDGLFSYIRQCMMIFATNKIDASLNSRTFSHMLSLPLQFFDTISAGILMRNMHQTEKIRSFLTGQLFHVALDISTLPILLVILALYSAKLTMIVLLFAALFAAVIGSLLPSYRSLLEQLFKVDGERQSILVETIHGMRTIKSLALEPSRSEAWDNALAKTIRQNGRVGVLTAKCTVLINFLDKIQTITILFVGVTDVFNGSLSLGALIAFNMMSGRVTGPLVQLVSLINSYQDTVVSLKYLGVVMDHKPEREGRQSGVRPVVNGLLSFENVTFLYPGSVTPAINRVSFQVEEGQMIGIVGRSGSGKTTITRLIQGIHTAQEGVIRLNNVDIRHIDLPYLRSNIGVVLQDNFLFRGTIRENLAIAKPNASLEEIVKVVRLAGAEEFIIRLPHSYNAFVEEAGANFSGGQRQRLAIARALLLQPRLLIFDEATSALDPDSEAIIQDNLEDIARNKTLLIVSHRLSSLVKSDAILVLEQGKVEDFAPHSVLVERCEVYRHLWHQQTKHIM